MSNHEDNRGDASIAARTQAAIRKESVLLRRAQRLRDAPLWRLRVGPILGFAGAVILIGGGAGIGLAALNGAISTGLLLVAPAAVTGAVILAAAAISALPDVERHRAAAPFAVGEHLAAIAAYEEDIDNAAADTVERERTV